MEYSKANTTTPSHPDYQPNSKPKCPPSPDNPCSRSELDYQGTDYALNAKAINPDVSDRACGIYTASYLQSVHPNVALGLEAILQRMPDPMRARRIYQETALNFVTRFILDKSILTLNLQQLSAMQASFFHKVSEKVEIGTEWQAVFAGPRKDSLCTASVKLDYKQARLGPKWTRRANLGCIMRRNCSRASPSSSSVNLIMSSRPASGVWAST